MIRELLDELKQRGGESEVRALPAACYADPEFFQLELDPVRRWHRTRGSSRCDDLGIVRGGIRTPWVEAPSAILSGDAPGGDGFMFLFGKTSLLDEDRLARLYPGGHDEHVARFEAATAKAVAEGFLLEADAEEIRALSRYGAQPSGWRP